MYSLAQRQELADHFWTATTPREAQISSSLFQTQNEIYFHTSPQPGQGNIALGYDSAFDGIDIEW